MPKLLFPLLVSISLISFPHKTYIPDSYRAKNVRANVWPRLQEELIVKGFKPGSPVYIRLFKETSTLEIWIKDGRQYRLFKSYEICSYSGGLGTKTVDGDGKSPEGFYTIEPKQLNPVSTYHLAINIGYPNKVEQLKGCTGSAIMIHGYCASIGCYAMTDPRIEEIYTLVYKAFEAGQHQIDVAIFPFRMNNERMMRYSRYLDMPFWKTLRPGYDQFEKTHVPPKVGIKGMEYLFK